MTNHHISKDDFANHFIQLLKSRGYDDDVEYDQERFELRLGPNDRMFLANCYSEFLNAPPTVRDDVLARYLNAVLEPPTLPDSVDDARARLLPILRDIGSCWVCDEQDGEITKIVRRPIAENLMIELALDYPNQVAYVRRKMMEDWGVDVDELFDTAYDNLKCKYADDLRSPSRGVYILDSGSPYDASGMCLPSKIRHIPVNGDHVVAVPNRQCMIVTGTKDAAGLVELAALTRRNYGVKHKDRLIGQVYRLTGDRWRPFMPPVNHRAYEQLWELHQVSTQDQYSCQTIPLTRLCQKRGDNAFVAQYFIRPIATAKHSSHCVVTERACPALLPRTDFVAFMRPRSLNKIEYLGTTEWKRFHDVLGQRIKKLLGVKPPRYRIEEFPSERQLRELKLRDLA